MKTNSTNGRVLEVVEGTVGSGSLHEIYTDSGGNWTDSAISGTAGSASAVSFALR